MPSYFPSAVNVYMSTGTSVSWIDISNRVLSDMDAELGMTDESYENRTADPASLYLNLKNSDGAMSPSSNFGKGTKLKIDVSYGLFTRTKFYGVIEEADVDVGVAGEQFVRVTATDWLKYTLSQPVRSRPVERDKRMDEAITGLVNDASIQPLMMFLDEGNTQFLTIYDAIDRDSTLYTELNNFVMSEYGYLYMDKGGQRLRVENRNARGGLQKATLLPAAQDGSALLLGGTGTSGNYLRRADGGKLLLNPTQQAFFSGTFAAEPDNPKIVQGKHIINDVEFVAYPKDLDASNVVLYALPHSTPVFIPALGSKRITGFFKDPHSGEGQIAGTDFVALVPYVDYFMYEHPDETGASGTANLTITPTYSANSAEFLMVNAGIGGWVTHLNQRGIGIYNYNPVSIVVENTPSKDVYGVKNLSIRQVYQQDTKLGEEEAEKILDIERQPRNVLVKAKLKANASDLNMQAFMHLDIGSLVRIVTNKPSVDSYYYINGLKWKIRRGGEIDVTWVCKELPSFTQIAVDFPNFDGGQDAVDFGNPDVLSNLAQRTYVADIYMKSATTAPIMGKYSGTAQSVLFLFGDGHFRYVHGWNGTDGQWRTLNPNLTGTTPLNKWMQIGITYDYSNVTNNPLFYVTGASVPITQEVGDPTGAPDDDSDIRFMLGNAAFPSIEWSYHPHFLIRNARVFNRCLSATEMAYLQAHSNDPDAITDGLVFNAPFVRNFRYPDYLNHQITTDMKVFDRVGQLAGTVHYSGVTGSYIYGRDPSLSSY